MDATFASQIVSALKTKFEFRKTRGTWLQEGRCPQCNERELFTAANDPKMIKCGRMNNCGFEMSVREALPDLFEDWSKRFEQTETDPNAAADAYLRYERGLDLTGLRDAFTQETYVDKNLNCSSATVRFPLPGGSWWERIIDRPGRFDKKARFKFGGSWAGHCWAHPDDTFERLATMDEIWIAEGIFDALALRQNFARLAKNGGKSERTAVSAMTVNVWPEHFLEELRKAIAASGNPKHRPELVFAFDVGPAGIKFTRKFVQQAKREGWDAHAAQVRPDGEGAKLDWNDLWLRQQDWKGDEAAAPLGANQLYEYRWNGDVTIETDYYRKAELIHRHRARRTFYYRHDNRIYWAKARAGGQDDDDGSTLIVDEVANCNFRILYRERDEASDETNYFLEIRFPNATPTAKARFSAACCAASGEFKKRLFAFSGMWAGNQEQLDRLMRDQTRTMKTVEPLHFTGYSANHDAWVLGDLAIHDGRVVKLSSERYFDIGKSAVKLRTEERILSVTYDPDKIAYGWISDVWTAWGPNGLITLAFFTMSLFAVQIRERDQSLGFLEIFGEAGSGKTTLITFMWKLFGRAQYEGFDPNKATNAAIARNFLKVSNLPVGLIESGREQDKANHFRAFDWAELLTLFNGRSPRSVGVKSSGTETFEPPFLGSIYLMQNNPVDAMPAVLERIMSIRIDKSTRTEETRAAAQRIARYDMEDASGWIVHVTRHAKDYLPAFFKAFDRHNDTMRDRVADLYNDRIILCHAQLAAAVEMLAHLFPKNLMPVEWIKHTIDHIDKAALDRQTTSGGDHPVVRRFWEIADYILNAETQDHHLEGRSLNQSRKPDQVYAINLVEFERRARQMALTPPTDDELKKHLRGSRSRKFIDLKVVNNPNGHRVHCWVFENPDAGGPLV
ncbi:MAG: toprim domain-containing protein [Caenibius sp.]